jgi:hypothetical protein
LPVDNKKINDIRSKIEQFSQKEGRTKGLKEGIKEINKEFDAAEK